MQAIKLWSRKQICIYKKNRLKQMNLFEILHLSFSGNLYTAPGHRALLYTPCKKIFCIPGISQLPHDVYDDSIFAEADHS